MDNTKKNPNVPNLRFKEYSFPWEQVKLKQYCEVLQGLTYKPENVSKSGILVLRSSNIQDSRLCFEDNVYVDCKIPSKISTQENDVLICVRNGSKNLVGKTAIIGKEYEGLAWGAFMNILRPIDNQKFLYYYLNSSHFKNQIKADLNTATVNQITGNMFDYCKINIPQGIDEVKKISCFLDLIEQRIDTQIKIIDKYESLIKSINYKLANDSIDLKSSLSELFYIRTGTKLKEEQTGKYLMVDMGTISETGNYINFKYTNDNTALLSTGTLVMPKDDIGGGKIICKTLHINEPNKYALSDHVFALEIKDKSMNALYFSSLINSIPNNRKLKKLVTGSAQLGINLENLSKYNLEYTNSKILQNKYAILIEDLNKLILNEKNVLNNLYLQKLYLLKNMFI